MVFILFYWGNKVYRKEFRARLTRNCVTFVAHFSSSLRVRWAGCHSEQFQIQNDFACRSSWQSLLNGFICSTKELLQSTLKCHWICWRSQLEWQTDVDLQALEFMGDNFMMFRALFIWKILFCWFWCLAGSFRDTLQNLDLGLLHEIFKKVLQRTSLFEESTLMNFYLKWIILLVSSRKLLIGYFLLTPSLAKII